ncbi:transglutaminase domain-containing protein [Candidatus Pacearchaeota archaeon]|nr:transglutaminase domain-containing protein [Candidatus Pacearchaeota archaeon]
MTNKKSLLTRIASKKNLKNLALTGLLALFVDRLAVPIVSYFYCAQGIRNEAIQESMETGGYLFEYCGEGEETALEYLKLAHAVTTKYISIGATRFNFSDSEFLESRLGDCSETSRFTYSNFIYLANSAKKPDLLNYVRLASGTVSSHSGGGGHMWIEILKDGVWIPYETTARDLKEGVKINPATIDDLIPDSLVLNDKGLRYHHMTSYQVDKDGNLNKTIDLDRIIESEGFFRLAYKNIFN